MLHWLGWILVELAFLHSNSKLPWFLVGPSNLPPPGLCHAVKCCDGNWLSPGDIYTKRWSKWNDPQMHVELLLLGSFWSHQGNFRFVLWWSRSTFVDNQSLYQTNFCVFYRLYMELPKALFAWTMSDHFSTLWFTLSLTFLMVEESSSPIRIATWALWHSSHAFTSSVHTSASIALDDAPQLHLQSCPGCSTNSGCCFTSCTPLWSCHKCNNLSNSYSNHTTSSWYIKGLTLKVCYSGLDVVSCEFWTLV